jgi:hypothetical protein
MGLASKIVQALDSEDVQAKIFNVIVKPFFDAHMAAFGRTVGEKVGDELAEVRQELRKLRQLRDECVKADDLASNPDQAATDTDVKEAASPAGLKTRSRKTRRLRAKSKYEYSRSLMLSVKTLGAFSAGEAVNDMEQASDDQFSNVEPVLQQKREFEERHWSKLSTNNAFDRGTDLSLQQRLGNLELVVTSFLQFPVCDLNCSSTQIEWGPWQSAIPAEVLAQECAAAKVIQRAWRNLCIPPYIMHNAKDVPFVTLPSVGTWLAFAPPVVTSLNVQSNDLVPLDFGFHKTTGQLIGAYLLASRSGDLGMNTSQSTQVGAKQTVSTISCPERAEASAAEDIDKRPFTGYERPTQFQKYPCAPAATSRPRLIGIRRGGAIGVFDNWEHAKVHIAGHPGVEFKSFSSRSEAAAWVETGTNNILTHKTK